MPKSKEEHSFKDRSLRTLENTALTIGAIALLFSLIDKKFIADAAIAGVAFLGFNSVRTRQ